MEKEPKKNILRYSTDLKNNKFIDLKNHRNNRIDLIQSTKINVFRSSQKIVRAKIPKICRICYEEEDPISNYDNPLIQPCTCSGSLRYIHLNCLKHWLYTKSCTKILSNELYSAFLIQPVQCEICKTKFPDFLKHKDKLYEILDFKSEFDNYFTIESLTLDKNNTKFFYVVNLDKNVKLKIGRGKDSQLTLGDISVSRVHATLTIENKNIYIEDNNSKFGTLILVQSPTLKLVQNLPLSIQIGRTFLDCRVQEINHNIFSCCDVNERPSSNFYFQQNKKQKQLGLINMFNIKSEIDFTEDYDNEIEEKEEKDFVNFDENKNINNRYEDNTLDIDNTNRISKCNIDDLKVDLFLKRKSLFKDNIETLENEDNKDNKNDNEDDEIKINEEIKKEIIKDKIQSVIIESENEK